MSVGGGELIYTAIPLCIIKMQNDIIALENFCLAFPFQESANLSERENPLCTQPSMDAAALIFFYLIPRNSVFEDKREKDGLG